MLFNSIFVVLINVKYCEKYNNLFIILFVGFQLLLCLCSITDTALKYISISEELSRADYFTASYLSKYYFSQNDSQKGKDYHDMALSCLEILNSERNRKYQIWYNSKPLNNQIIPTASM